MKHEVTRDVVSDLWPLCRSGDATADSRKLVKAFFAQDPDFEHALEESAKLTEAMPPLRLSPDAERRLLDDARRRARLRLLIIGAAVLLGGLILLGALAGAFYVVVARG